MATPSKNGSTVTKVEASASSLTQSYTVASGSNRCLTVRFHFYNSNNGTPTCTYGGVSMTLVGSTELGGDTARSGLFRLLAPTVGAANVVFTPPGGGSGNLHVIIDQWADVDQTTPFGSWASIDSTVNTAAPSWNWNVTAAVDDLVIDALAVYSSSVGGGAIIATPGSGQTTDGEAVQGGVGDHLYGSRKVAAGTSVNMAWSFDSDVLAWGGGAAMKGASGGGGGSILPLIQYHRHQQGIA